VLSTLDPATQAVAINVGPAMAVGDDPIIRHFGTELFIVNRFDLHNVTILDDATLALKEQRSTGDNSNPQDVAAVGNKLYVATYAGAGVTVITRGSDALTTIDLSADDPDGNPNCNSIYLAGGALYVTCQLLDENFAPRANGKVYVIDPATAAVKTSLTLTNKNPFSLLEEIPGGAPHAGDLVVSTVPDILSATPNGCVERIAIGAAPAAAGCVVDHAGLGGYVTRMHVQLSEGLPMMWSAVTAADSFARGDLRGFDLGGTLWPALNAPAERIGDVVQCPSGEVVVTDTTMNANGLRIYDSGGAEVTTAALPIGLRPLSQHGLVCY